MTRLKNFASRGWQPGLLLVAISCLLTGCSEEIDRVPVYPVSGEVTFQGTPAEGALVVFHPADSSDPGALRPSARVDDSGKFQLTTYETNDGAPAGKYQVTFLWPEPPKSPVDDPDMGEDRLKGRYTNPQQSPFEVLIGEQPTELPVFELK